MNKVYKVVWSDAANAWVAVSEISTAHGKSKSSKTIAVAVVAVGMVLSSAAVQAAGITWGTGAVASGNDAIAMGSRAKANARYDITIGHQAGALSGEGPNSGNSGERVTIGSHATVGSNQAISVNAGGSLGTVNLAVKSVGQSVAIGSGTGALPENRTYAYGDQSLAIGSDTLAYGDSSVAIGGDDLDKAGAQKISYTDPTNDKRVNGTVRQAYQALTGDTMQNGVYIKTASKQAGVSVGIQAQSGDLGVALGAKSNASGTASTAIGTGASANKDNAIALGAGSKTNTNATQVTSATVGGLTYGNFAGNSSVAVGDQVSVGNTGFERQIKHVAPGEISAASTDAINGSQLYATQKTLGNVGNTVKTILGGNAAIDADGNITMSNIGGTGQNTIHDAIQAAKTKVQAADNSPVTVTGTGSSTDPYKVGVNTVTLAPATGTDAGKVAAPATGDAGKLVTAGDIANAINSSGFKATAGGNTTGATPTQELIKAGDTLTLKAGDGLTVEQSGSTFTYALNAQQITQNAQTPVVYTKADGSKVYKHTDGNFYDQPNGAGTQVAAGDVIASMNAGDNTTSTPTTLANVKGNLADAATATANPANNSRSDFAGKGNNAATVNDVLNAGFNVQGNGVAKDFVTHGDTINFVNGQGTVANVTSTNGVTEVKFDTPLSYADATGNNTTTPSNAVNLVGSDPSKPVTLGNVAEGVKDTDAVNVAQLKASQTKVVAGTNIASVDHDAATNTYTVNAKGSETSGVNDETVVTATNDPTTNTTTYNVGLADKVKDDIKKGVDAADAVNNKGLTFKGDSGDTGVKKLGDEVSITGDSNITTKADGNGVQVSLNRDVDVDSVKAGDSTLNNDGLTINGGPSVTKTGIDAADKKVTNVANGDVTATSKDAVNGSQLHQHGDGVKNIIGGNTTYDPNTGSYTNNDIGGTGQSTIDDAIRHINSTANAGWNLQTNGGATEKVGSGETVNFKNGNNISITNTGKEITIATNPDLTADSLTINNGGPVINGNGINMGDKKITNVADGDISDTSKDAVNGSQLHATNQNVANNTANIAKGFNFGDGNTANNYQLGDTISVKGDNNVTSTTVNGGVQLGLNQNLSLTSVTTGNTKMDNNGLTINGGPSVTTNGVDAGGKKITNVAAGEADTDAVNVGQLNQKLGTIAGANTAHVAALEQKINNVEDEADAGTASAMATAGLPQAYLPGKSMIAVGASNYRGKTGYAVGFSAITDGGNWIIKGTASGNSKGRFGASIGAGYQW